MDIEMLDTIKGSLLESFYPQGWDLKKIHECCAHTAEEVLERQSFWHKDFQPIACDTVESFYVKFGHEGALQIKKARDEGRKIAMILPAGPVGQYKWMVYFLKEWNVKCDHVYGFNMDEWADAEGNTPRPSYGSFKNDMLENFYKPLGQLTVPESQRNFATKDNLPHYREKIDALRAEGAKLVMMFGIGRAFHIAFWEPHFAADFASEEEWKKADYRIAAKLHPLTVEQNSITVFDSNYTRVPCRANTIGPGLMLQSDYVIGGCSSIYDRGASLQGVPLWVTLRHGPNMWMTSTYMPTMPGKLFFVEQLAESRG